MSGKLYFCLFILCGFLCEKISGVFSKDVDASNTVIRTKRVINMQPGGDVPLRNGDAPFVVNIRRLPNNKNIGVGSILSKHTVITAADCVAPFDVSVIKILVGATKYYHGVQHDVLIKNVYLGNHQRETGDGIALLTIVPGIVFDSKASVIHLYQGHLYPGQPATIYGWGCNPTSPRGTNCRDRLRSITVPIMNHGECAHSYRRHFLITENDICTYEDNKKCGHTDSGAPLVIENQLAGVHLRGVQIPYLFCPDVFVALQSFEYASWIRNNIIYNVVHMQGSN